MAGRPPFAPTKDQRDQVEIAAGGECTDEEIASHLGIDVKTLKKHFAEELREGARRRRVAMKLAMYSAGIKGSVPAQKAYLGLSEPDAGDTKRSVRQLKDKPLGKKETVRRAALLAGEGTEWEEDLRPPPGTLAN